MNRFRAAGTVLCVVALSFQARSQAVLPEHGKDGGLRQNVYGLGLAAGAASGVGLSFRHHLPGYFSYQITGGIIKVDKQTSSAVGLELQYDFIRAAGMRFFALAAFGYYYSGKEGGNELTAPGRAGAGVGLELPIQGGFHITGELLFTYFTDGTVLPLPQVGLFYYFY